VPDPVFDGGFGGRLVTLGRGEGRIDPGRPSCAGPLASGDSRVVRGASDVDFVCTAPGDISATMALARSASAADVGLSAMGGSDAGGAGGSEAPGAATSAEPAKRGFVPMSSIEPPASRRASSRSSAACFMTVCSCFGSVDATGLDFGNIAAWLEGRGGEECEPGGRDDDAGCGDGCAEAPTPRIVDFPTRLCAARAVGCVAGADASASDS
jgi:hypothetical protein